MAESNEIPLNSAAGARGNVAGAQHSLYAEGVSSVYVEGGAKSLYAEGFGARSLYSEGARAPLDAKSVRLAIKVAKAQVRNLSPMARLHNRLGRIDEYLNK